MCGIFGQFKISGIPDARERSRKLFDTLKHRGPDDRGAAYFGTEDRPYLLLGQTRLSIIDLSSAGHQPMTSDGGRYTLVYNGEIYNFRELRSGLEKKGYRFHSGTDTEVLLHHLAEYGTPGLTKLNGMFAFAFYDREKNTLLCARDYFGIKPFYYDVQEGEFSFASEVPAMRDLGSDPALDPGSVRRYLVFGRYDSGAATFFRDIRALPPGHFLTLDLNTGVLAEPVRFWKPDILRTSDISFEEAAGKVRDIFLRQVEEHLISDVPLGIALSGGIDSSAVACAVRHLHPDRELHTFSYLAGEEGISEEDHIRLVEKEVRSVPHHTGFDSDTLRERLDDLMTAQGEPFGSTSIFAQFRVFECARENGVTVLLEGQGADELFGGYTGYPDERLRTLWNQGRFADFSCFLREASRIGGRSRGSLLGNVLASRMPHFPRRLLYSAGKRWRLRRLMDCFTPDFRRPVMKEIDDPVSLREQIFPVPEGNAMRQCLAWQLTTEGLPHLLRHGDRNGMFFSLESRVPFLTREMAEFCLSLPEDMLVTKECLTKAVFRRAMRGIVPDSILDRRDKIGFATPEKTMFLRNPDWVRSRLLRASRIPFLRGDRILSLGEDILRGRLPFDHTLWRWINFIAFYEKYGM